MTVQTSKRKAKKTHAGPAWHKIAALVLLIVGLAAIWRYTPLAEYVTPENARESAERIGDMRWAPLAVIALYIPASLLMFPRPLITLFAVIAFGPWTGFAIAIVGIMIAAVATFYVGRALPRRTVRNIAGAKLDMMTGVLRKRGLLAVLAVRIVPVGPFAVVGMVAGAIRIRLWHFVAGTFLGMLPGTLTTTVFGDQLQAALEDPSQINYWIVGGVLLVFAVGMFFMRRWFVKQHHLQHS